VLYGKAKTSSHYFVHEKHEKHEHEQPAKKTYPFSSRVFAEHIFGFYFFVPFVSFVDKVVKLEKRSTFRRMNLSDLSLSLRIILEGFQEPQHTIVCILVHDLLDEFLTFQFQVNRNLVTLAP